MLEWRETALVAVSRLFRISPHPYLLSRLVGFCARNQPGGPSFSLDLSPVIFPPLWSVSSDPWPVVSRGDSTETGFIVLCFSTKQPSPLAASLSPKTASDVHHPYRWDGDVHAGHDGLNRSLKRRAKSENSDSSKSRTGSRSTIFLFGLASLVGFFFLCRCTAGGGSPARSRNIVRAVVSWGSLTDASRLFLRLKTNNGPGLSGSLAPVLAHTA